MVFKDMPDLKKTHRNQDASGKPKPVHGGAREGAGRKRGVVSQIKLSMAERAREHAPDALRALYEIAIDKDVHPGARVSAANSIIDRAYGRPLSAMQITGKDGGPVEHTVKARVIIVPSKEVAEVSSRPMQNGDIEG